MDDKLLDLTLFDTFVMEWWTLEDKLLITVIENWFDNSLLD